MVVFPHCKINLGLQILSKREDGYHNIVTCFYPVPWTDILEIIKSDKFFYSSSGIAIQGHETENLCLKAYRLLCNDFDLPPIKIHLHKVIPTGAGLGGGSSDAAFALRTLNSLFSLSLPATELSSYAAGLGSDCSFFLDDKPKMGSGRGEILSEAPVSLKGLYLVLVKPDIHVSTAEAYAGVKPQLPVRQLSDILSLPVAEWKDVLINDFELSVFHKYPALAIVKNSMYQEGAMYASMSGSGSSVFGIFNAPIDLKNKFEGTYWAGELE